MSPAAIFCDRINRARDVESIERIAAEAVRAGLSTSAPIQTAIVRRASELRVFAKEVDAVRRGHVEWKDDVGVRAGGAYGRLRNHPDYQRISSAGKEAGLFR